MRSFHRNVAASILLCMTLLVLTTYTFKVAFPHATHATHVIPQTDVSVSPSSVTADVDLTFNVDVIISSVFDLYGWQFSLNWSASLLDLFTVTEGPFLRTGGDTFFAYSQNDTVGHMVVDCTLLGGVPGVYGGGTLATITFYVESAGESVLDLHDVILIDSHEQLIPCQIYGGYWQSSYSHDVAIASVNASPTVIPQGGIVNIDVVVQNQGDFTETFDVTVHANTLVVGVQSILLGNASSTNLSFTWNTTNAEKDDYLICASAEIVPDEEDVEDNINEAPDLVTVLYAGHDVAVIGVESFKTIVGQGYCMFVRVTVKNYGTFAETFDAITYANLTVIQIESVTLESGGNRTLSIIWNTSSFVKGIYEIRSYSTVVLGENDTSDNTYINGYVIVSVKCDISSQTPNLPDGLVNMADVALTAKAFGTSPGDDLWSANADISGVTLGLPDSTVDMRDVSLVARHFGT